MSDTSKLDSLFNKMNLDGGQSADPPPIPKDPVEDTLKSLSKISAKQAGWIAYPTDNNKFVVKALEKATAEEFLAWCKWSLPFLEPDDSILKERSAWPTMLMEVVRIHQKIKFPVNLHERITPEKKKPEPTEDNE